MCSNPSVGQEEEKREEPPVGGDPNVNLLLGLLPLSTCVTPIVPLANIFVPLIVWLCVRRANPDSKPAFRSVMNMQISWTLYCVVSIILFFAFSLVIFMGANVFTWKEAFSYTMHEKVEYCEPGKQSKDDSNQERKPEHVSPKESHSMKSSEDGSSFSRLDGMVKITSDDGKIVQYDKVPGMMLGLFFLQVVVWICIFLTGAGGIVWLIMTILFAVKVKDDPKAKPPLTIRFLS